MRIILLVVGLALLACSLAALSYALGANEPARTSATLAPTLFTLPPGGLP